MKIRIFSLVMVAMLISWPVQAEDCRTTIIKVITAARSSETVDLKPAEPRDVIADIQRRVKFRPDGMQDEGTKKPQQTLKDGYGDCEDIATLVLTQLRQKAHLPLTRLGFMVLLFPETAPHIVAMYRSNEPEDRTEGWTGSWVVVDYNFVEMFLHLDSATLSLKAYLWLSWVFQRRENTYVSQGLEMDSPVREIYNKEVLIAEGTLSAFRSELDNALLEKDEQQRR